MEMSCDTVWNYTLEPSLALEDIYSTFDTVAITILMPLLLFFGILGNLAFLLMLYRVPRMRSLTNFYLANLAASDIAFLLFAISKRIHDYRIGSVNFSPAHNGVLSCFIQYLVVDLSYFASLFVISLVSVEKFYAICRPMRHRVISRWDRTIKLTVCSWIVSLGFATTVIPSYCSIGYVCIIWPGGGEYDHLPGRFAYCAPAADWAVPYANALQTAPFFIALVLNTTAYTLIVKQLTQRVNRPHGPQAVVPFPDQAIKLRDQVAKMLVVKGTAFFLLLAPFEIVSILLSVNALSYSQRMVALQICRLFSYLNSAINPLIFGMVSSKYRHAYREAFLPARGNRVGLEPTPAHSQDNRSATHQIPASQSSS
ncbi:growth hormone secretagogue receptor type 1-like [Acanthaster planci]|uniref:Growth hormone secretagogue receptor type 1-like n=1 Tax=Acanthaster planci TaxID=133434 RepID=A0A8B7XVX6_ACAPL|nr:growth hormone secretagogue receptor type 1-like [Acanthaster planci]